MSQRNTANALNLTRLIQVSQLAASRTISLLVLVLLITYGGAG